MMRVLAVDDSYALRRLFWRVLSRKGCQVEMAADAEEALEVSNEGDFDLAFIDVDLGIGINGFELARKLRELRPDLRIVLMSGRFKYEEAALTEFDGFLPKPFDLDQIRSFVTQK